MKTMEFVLIALVNCLEKEGRLSTEQAGELLELADTRHETAKKVTERIREIMSDNLLRKELSA